MSSDAFLARLKRILPESNLYTDPLRRLAWGTDAGFYRLTPQIIIRSRSEEDISSILQEASAAGIPVTFRAAGTSLSGQAVSDSVLVVAGKNWEKWHYNDDTTVTLQPGLVGAEVNRLLARYGRKFGPDPASIGSCMVGGIVMNNASGMSCGIHANSDRMLRSVRMVLADGTVLDTGDPASRKAFSESHPDFLRELAALRDEVLADPELTERIRYKYSIKNVTGLNLLPLITYTDPFDIAAHLLVGSEGTLAFLSEVTMDTLPIAPFKASAMIYFKDIRSAAEGVVAMPRDRITAAELLDIRSLTAVHDPHLSTSVPDLTAVLTETQAETHDDLLGNIEAIREALAPFGVSVEFTEDPAVYSQYWAIRSGIFPAVGGLRKEGTTCLIEDVAFHIQDLPQATSDLSALLDKHGYDDSCIYGHALEGNFHFIINQSFATEADVRRYEAMIRDVAEMVVGKYDGSLKAEHGTGRNMAPFVEYEWGAKAFSVMKRIKALFDPKGILNPGVIFNDDPDCFIKDFKALPILRPAAEDPELAEAYKSLNKCIECGFCEVNCVSCGFTLSSRTRIVAQREIARLRESGGDPELLRELERAYRYYGDVTCAADGLCSMSCPMGINVADLTHDIRHRNLSPSGARLGAFAADHLHGVKNGLRGVLGLTDLGQGVLGTKAMTGLGKGLHKVGLPLWTPATPKPYRVPDGLTGKAGSPLKVVYFPSCLNQMMGLPKKGSPVRRPLVEEMVALLEKAGYEVIFPENKDSLCCGMIWESKGLPGEAERKVRELDDALWKASCEGLYPVLCDQSPCLHRMRGHIKRMHLYEPVEFIWKFLRERLDFHPTDTPVAVHPTCSTRLMGLDKMLVSLAQLCSSSVTVPEGVGCCGFAGDKGMTHPELNAYALRKLKDQVRDIPAGYSNSRTCEIGLTTNSGIPYLSIAYLVNACTTAK